MRPADLAYDPRAYWRRRIAGDGALANVGQVALGEYNRYTYPLRLEAFTRALDASTVVPSSVFDAGFGEGVYLEYWARRGVRQVAGLDFSERAVRAAVARHPGYALRAGDLSAPTDLAGFATYQVVTAIDVLYHIVDDDAWAAALANLLALVAPNGAFLFSDKFPAKHPVSTAPHVRRRPLAQWAAGIARHGFEVARIVPVFCLMDDPITCGNHPRLGWLARLQWRVATRLIRETGGRARLHRAVVGGVARLQRRPERWLVQHLARTPNLEIAVCRPRAASDG